MVVEFNCLNFFSLVRDAPSPLQPLYPPTHSAKFMTFVQVKIAVTQAQR